MLVIGEQIREENEQLRREIESTQRMVENLTGAIAKEMARNTEHEQGWPSKAFLYVMVTAHSFAALERIHSASAITGPVSPNGAGTLKPARSKWPIGTKIRKQFGNTLYRGTIVSYDRCSGELRVKLITSHCRPYYKVVYEDNDCEDMDAKEVERCVDGLLLAQEP
jgi:hypothetical protein